MAKTQKNNIRDLVGRILTSFLEEHGLELYHTEFRKEGKDWYLRVFIDRTDDEYVSTDDCEAVSRFLSEELDREDPIQQNYYLEVSSPGMDRPLLTQEHFDRYAGEIVDLKLYKARDGQKEFQGKLIGRTDGVITIETEDGQTVACGEDETAGVRLAVIF
ncbi:MAG: ribosome maturation factor RimP [Eubacterium sp.]|nr:ribosome maturation factor RimP [Eubacterium sp.]